MIDSKFFIICFLAIIAFCQSEELSKIKSNNTLKGQTKKLYSDYFESCNSNYECSGDHRKCVDDRCRCAADYKYNYVTKKCDRFYCYLDSDCQEYDFYRHCSYKSCYCDSGYNEDYTNGNKCKYSYTPSSSTGYYYYDFTWVWILTAIIILVKISILVFYIRRRRRYLAAVRANLQPVTIVANAEYGTTAYQTNHFPAGYPQNFNNPPPPYSIR